MKIALVGYGRMGRAVEEVAAARGHEIVARLDVEDSLAKGVSASRLSGADVAIEFTAPEAAVANLTGLAASGVDVVSGTTGWYESLEEVKQAVRGAHTGLIYAPNFSLGVQILFRLAEAAGRLCDRLEEYDPYILETHHRHKVDHPSGTARKLADIVLDTVSRKVRWALGPGQEGSVDPSVLQVSVIRAGENPGIHVLGLEGPDDRIELRHEVRSRAGFARGAVAAAEWIRGREGVFTLDDMLAELWS